jgi:hypothetical protein
LHSGSRLLIGDFPTIERLAKDLKDATATMSEKEARFLVEAYHIIQEDRKRFKNQTTAMGGEPHAILPWFFQQNQTLEKQLHAALDRYSASKPIGQWAALFGIGPVITAVLMAPIDIKQCPTAGHIWRFVGLNPTSKWAQGEKRPWNAGLKTLCQHIGQSFMKLHNNGTVSAARYMSKGKLTSNSQTTAAAMPSWRSNCQRSSKRRLSHTNISSRAISRPHRSMLEREDTPSSYSWRISTSDGTRWSSGSWHRCLIPSRTWGTRAWYTLHTKKRAPKELSDPPGGRNRPALFVSH